MDFYATLGDPCAKRDILEQLFQSGMTGVRLNMSHTSLAQCAPLLEELYWPAARQAGRGDAHLILDLQGPELRVGELPQPIPLREGLDILLATGASRSRRSSSRRPGAASRFPSTTARCCWRSGAPAPPSCCAGCSRAARC